MWKTTITPIHSDLYTQKHYIFFYKALQPNCLRKKRSESSRPMQHPNYKKLKTWWMNKATFSNSKKNKSVKNQHNFYVPQLLLLPGLSMWIAWESNVVRIWGIAMPTETTISVAKCGFYDVIGMNFAESLV